MSNYDALIKDIRSNPNQTQLKQLVKIINGKWKKDCHNSAWTYTVCPNGSLSIDYVSTFFPGCLYFNSREKAINMRNVLGDDVILNCIE